MNGTIVSLDENKASPLHIGRYALYGEIASGGMATVHLGRLVGDGGFARTVAVKRLHPQFAKDPDFVTMFMDEARLAARIHHPNVVATLDVTAHDGELFLVMDYVEGESLARLARTARKRNERIPLPIIATVVRALLDGLHAAHEATDEKGRQLDIVHRDVSPQNVLVGTDGVARMLDFGVAKASSRAHATRDGEVKGKIAYMAPEQLKSGIVDRRADLYATGVVLWELLTGERFYGAGSDGEMIAKVLNTRAEPPSLRGGPPNPALDDVVMRALSVQPKDRFATARSMANALEEATGPMATTGVVGEWVNDLAGDVLSQRERAVADMESAPTLAAATMPAEPVTKTRWSTRTQGRTLFAFCAGVTVAAILFIVIVRVQRSAVVSAEAPSSAVAWSSPEPAPEPSEPAPEPSDSASPASESTPAPSARGAAPRTISTRAPARPPARRKAAASSCAVKSYVDEAGVKHFYEDCPRP